MRIIVDRLRPKTLVAIPTRHALLGATAVTAFGLFALAGAVNTLTSQPSRYRVYAFILLVLAIPCLMIGVIALARRTRFIFDTAAGTLVIERSGLRGTRRVSHPLDTLDAVLLVRYWFFNRVARADRQYWYRIHVRTAADTRIEIAPRLRLAAAAEAADAIAAHLAVPVIQEDGRAEGVVAGR